MLHRINYTSVIVIFIITLSACDVVDNSNPGNTSGEWLIAENEVFDGGPGKDGIPALTSPSLTDVNSAQYLSENDLVLLIDINNEIRIYPHPILDWHEIINDKIGTTPFAVTYCPLTGTGICWDTIIDDEETTFGVSGLLYNTNLIAYDRKTNSNWSQMRLQSVNGSLISTLVKTIPIFETSWKTARTSFPDAKVVSSSTGYSRNYEAYPYGDYKTNHSSLFFPVNHNDDRVSAKERVLGVFGSNSTKAYRILDFQDGKLMIDTIGEEKFIIYGNTENNILTAFKLTQEFINLEFSISTSQLPYIINDNQGNQYDLFGKSKKQENLDLIPAKSFIAYWFAWAAFYPGTDIYR